MVRGWGGCCCCWGRVRSSGNIWALLIAHGAEQAPRIQQSLVLESEVGKALTHGWTDGQTGKRSSSVSPKGWWPPTGRSWETPGGRNILGLLVQINPALGREKNEVFPRFQESRAQLLPPNSAQGSSLPPPGDSATARLPPWAPLLPISHPGMREDSVPL